MANRMRGGPAQNVAVQAYENGSPTGCPRSGDIRAEVKRRGDVVEQRHPDPADAYPYLVEMAEQFAEYGYD